MKNFRLLVLFGCSFFLQINVLSASTNSKQSESFFRTPNKSELQQIQTPFLSGSKLANDNVFVFLINGDQDHLRSDLEEGPGLHVDQMHLQEIEKISRDCGHCKVVILYDQNNLRKKSKKGSSLKVFSGGKLQINRTLPEINFADDQVLTKLLTFTQSLFPNEKMHVIYQGQGFYPNYLPKGPKDILGRKYSTTPFDLSHPKTFFGILSFAYSIREANLSKPISTLTLSANSMARIEVASPLSNLVEEIVASQLNWRDTPSVRSSFEFLHESNVALIDGEFIARKIARKLFLIDHGDLLPNEFPMSVIKVDQVRSMRVLIDQIILNYPEIIFSNEQESVARKMSLYQFALPRQYPSENVLRDLRNQDVSEEEMASLVEDYLTNKSMLMHDLDLKLFIEFMRQNSAFTEKQNELEKDLNNLENLMNNSVRMINASELSPMGGISFLLGF
jgi:hypothetical protein